MYVQKIFEETRVDVLHEFIHSHALGALVATTSQGLDANHLPFELIPEPQPFGTLRCHVGRSNPLWRDCAPGAEVMAMFQGPNAYISPSWFVNGKKSAINAPSWNYAAVHAYGTLRIIEDRDWLLGHLESLTNRNEAGRATPWKVSDASPDFVGKMLGAIVGIEIEITRLVGKWFVSQQRTDADRKSVKEHLLQERNDAPAAAIAQLIGQVEPNR